MKKYLILVIVIAVVAAGIVVRYLIVSPARDFALDLKAMNGITVGKTTEAELLGRSAFQTMDRHCFEANCDYHVERSNSFLGRLHLAPRMFVRTGVGVRDGMVTHVSVLLMRQGLTPIIISQDEKLPVACASNPCVKPFTTPAKIRFNFEVLFDNESELRNHMPEMVNTACLSRLHGCNSYAELIPMTKELNLDAMAH